MTDEKLIQTAIKILDVIKAENIENGDDIRRVIGLLLATVHTTLIAKSKEDRADAVRACMDSVVRIMMSLKNNIDEYKIEGFEILTGILVNEIEEADLQ